jgi:hypothetical protein
MTTRSDEAARLEEFARLVLAKAQAELREGREIMPAVITLTADDHMTIYALAGKHGAAQRADIQAKVIARDNAVATMFVADSNMRAEDDIDKIIGEALTCLIETRLETFMLCQYYRRDPFVFDPVTVIDNCQHKQLERTHGPSFAQPTSRTM